MTTTPHATTTPSLYAATRATITALPWEPVPGCTGVSSKVACRADGDVAGLLRLAPGSAEVQHLHEHGEHHAWVLTGTVYVGDQELPEGSYVHAPVGVAHALRDAGAGSTLFYVFHQAR